MVDFDPDAPGMKEITQGISRLLDDGHPNVPGLLRYTAARVEKAIWAGLVRPTVPQKPSPGADPQTGEWPKDGAAVIDITTRQRLN